jgi:hypothetical protein
MKKIAALHCYLASLNLVEPNKLDSWVEEMQVFPAGRNDDTDAGNGLKVICTESYTAQFRIDDYPHKHKPVQKLFAHISAWLLENDADRTIPFQFPVNPEVLDSEIALVEFAIAFEEKTLITPDPHGDIELNGEMYETLP